MFTAKAVTAINGLFETAIQNHARADAAEACVVDYVAQAPALSKDGKGLLVVLNISSYLFRIVALFDFGTDQASTAHLARLVRSNESTLSGQALHDACSELVNMICGTVNRSVCSSFRHAGMSTPFILERSCAQYLAEINPSATQALAVTVNETVHFNVTICLCCAADTEVDFSVEETQLEEAESGELELF